jgi:hypothetical protein
MNKIFNKKFKIRIEISKTNSKSKEISKTNSNMKKISKTNLKSEQNLRKQIQNLGKIKTNSKYEQNFQKQI